MSTIRLHGYADPLSVKAGQTVSFMISGEGTDHVDAKLVRLLHGDESAEGPGFVEEEVASAIPAQVAVKRQFTQLGGHAVVDDPKQLLFPQGDFTL